MTASLDRIQIQEAPMAAPGHCALCGTTQGPVVDFGMEMEFYGVIYFCIDNCLVQLANAFDYHSPRQWKMMMAQINEQRDEINALRDENERLNIAINSLTDLSGRVPVNRTAELDLDEVLNDPIQESEPDPNQLSFDFTGGESSTPEQVAESGSTDLSDDATDNDDEFSRIFKDI